MKCFICQKTFNSKRSLNTHLTRIHANELEKMENEKTEYCKLCGRKIPPKRHVSEDGIVTFVFDKDQVCRQSPCKSRTLNPGSLEYLLIVKEMSEPEAKEYLSAKGIKAGKKIIEKGIFVGDNNPQSKKYIMKKNGWTKAQATEFLVNKSKKSGNTMKKNGTMVGENNPASKQFLMNKGLTEEEAQRKQNERNMFTVDYWLKQGKSLEEAKKCAKKSSAFNEEYFIEKFGAELGSKKYEEHRQKLRWKHKISDPNSNRLNCLKPIENASKASLKYFIPLYKSLRKQGLKRRDIMFGVSGTREHFIREKSNIYFYDFFIKPLNIIIEYNGHHVHASERTSDEWRHAYSKKTKQEVMKIDENKKIAAENQGKKVIYIWSDLCYNDNIQTIEKELNKHGYSFKINQRTEPINVLEAI